MTYCILSPLVNREVANAGGMDQAVLRGEVSVVPHGRCVPRARIPAEMTKRCFFRMATWKPFFPIWETEEFWKT